MPSFFSDDDSDSDEDRRRGTPADKPRLPAWAESPALRQALASQSAADPDAIFGDVAPMRMEEIFTGSSLRRVRPRTSSANWTRDQLTAMETEAYAKYMGFKGKGKDSASASGSAGASGAPK